MPNRFWHTGIDSKVQGTWNISNALKGKDSDLDFFLLTSSISGSVGTATEGNYCAANYFLDNFARKYRSLEGCPNQGKLTNLNRLSSIARFTGDICGPRYDI
jgi:hypothetical protein